jgi:hypothetical protein
VTDPDNPDLTIGRWCGVIEEIDTREKPAVYLIRWDGRTRENMPPVFVKRCKRDDLELDIMWLDENQIEEDDGAGLPIEQPAQLMTRALDENDQDDRLRAIFNLTSDDAIPEADEVTLRIYHAYLTTHLIFPFEARWARKEGVLQSRSESVTILGLLPPEQIDPEDGVICDVTMGETKGDLPLSVIERDDRTPQGRLVADYTYWIHNWGDGPDVLPFPPHLASEDGQAMPQLSDVPGEGGPVLRLRKILHYVALIGGIYGTTLGAILATIEGARLGLLVGALSFAFLVGMAGRRYGMLIASMRQARRGPLIGGLVGLLIGGILGTLLGAMAVAFVGAIPGSIVGTVLGGLVARQGYKGWIKFLGGLLGACAGAIALAIWEDHEQALVGMLVGGVVGILGGIFLVLLALVVLAFVMSRRG